MFFDPAYFVFVGPALLLAFWAQWRVKSTYKRYSKVATGRRMTGADVAREILRASGVADVSVERVDGWLSDHYDPRSKTLRLSPGVYDGVSVAAAGIAAHEVGHAIQHHQKYRALVLRTAIAGPASIGSNLATFLLMFGFLFKAMGLVYVGIALFTVAVIFTLITLPVEFDASRRAKELLPQLGLVSVDEGAGVAKVLNAAALTYVAGAVAAIAQLLYFLMRAGLLGGSRS